MDKVMQQIKRIFKKIKSNHYVQVFGTIYLVGLLFFIVPTFANNLTLPLNGDYTLQTYAFYADGYTRMWNFFRTGEYPLFNYSNILGTDYFGSFTFYYSTSPFFLLLLLVPYRFLYQGIYLLLIFKYAIGGTFFYMLLKKYFRLKDRTCFIGAIAYAFSGWTLYFLWFHFSDVVAVFPLIFMGIEMLLQKKKRWLLVLSFFLLGITNYFFLLPLGMLSVLYAIFRWMQLYYFNKNNDAIKYSYKILGQGILCILCGILLSGIVLFPSYLIVLESGRAESTLLIDFLKFFFKDPQRIDGSLVLGDIRQLKDMFSFKYVIGAGETAKTITLYDFIFKFDVKYGSTTKSIPGYVLTEFFIMNFRCIGNAAYNTGLDPAMGGMFITTPMALLVVPSCWNAIKKKNVLAIIGCVFCIALPFLPFTYYLLQGFTSIYGRWHIFLVVVALIFVLHTFDKIEEVHNNTFIVAILVNICLTLIGLNMSLKNGSLSIVQSNGKYLVPSEHLIAYGLQIIYMFMACMLFIGYRNKKWFSKMMVGLVCAEVMVSCTLTAFQHGFADESTLFGGQEKLREEKTVIDYIQDNDGNFYRISNAMATRAYTNLPATLSYNGISTFNSIYNNNLDDFLDRGKVKYGGSWSMGYHEKRAYFDEFLGIKYYIVNKEDINNDGVDDKYIYNGTINANTATQNYALNLPFGYSLYKDFDTFAVYVNNEFIHLGFAYDNYIKNSVLGTYNDALYYDKLYSELAIVEDYNLKEVKDLYKGGTQIPSYSLSNITYVTSSRLDKYLSLREDCSDYTCHNISTVEPLDRHLINISTQDELRNALANSYKTDFMRSRWYEYNFFGDQFIIDNKQGTTVCGDASVDNPCYVEINFQMGPNALISLFNGNKLLTQDAHMTHNYAISSTNYERKKHRGFYVTEPITRTVVEFLSDTTLDKFNIGSFSYQYSYYRDFKNAFDKFKAYPLEDIVVGVDSYQFKTNYDKEKILVLNVPYSNGWSLKINGKDTKIFRMQGGFIGIIANSGESQYELSYYTPGLKTGIWVSILGLLLAAFITITFNHKIIYGTLLYSKKVFDDAKKKKGKKDNKDKENEEDKKDEQEEDLNVNYFINKKGKQITLPLSRKKMDLLLEILRFIIVGGIATLVDFIVYLLTRSILPDNVIRVYLATFFGFMCGLVISYVLSLLFVFLNNNVTKMNNKKTMITFAITSLIGLGITELGMLFGHGLLGFYDTFVRIIMIAIVLVWNYIAKKIYVFKESK